MSFRDVVKRYGSLAALDGLTLDVPQGEVFGLLGPNGSGKTTSIRVLMGLERATSGETRALGKRPGRGNLSRIGYMPQETALYADLSVMENLELFGAMFGLARREVRTRADDLLGLVDLSQRADAVVGTLSGGMKHRTSLVVALLHEPDLLVLDEPTVGVDPELRAGFWKYFRDLRSEGRTILITTHYMDEARNCDRVGFLRQGRLIASGGVRDILDETGTSDLEDAFLAIAGRTAPAQEAIA